MLGPGSASSSGWSAPAPPPSSLTAAPAFEKNDAVNNTLCEQTKASHPRPCMHWSEIRIHFPWKQAQDIVIPSSCTGIAHTSHVDKHTSASLVQQLHIITLYLSLSLTELLTPAGWLCGPALNGMKGASQPSWDRHHLEICVEQAGLVLKFLTCSFKSSLLSGNSF